MILSRWVAGLAAMVTAMLVQATLIGPLFFPLPASLPLVLVVSVAVLAGPSAGICIGFAGGLLVDLASQHPFGLFALCWLAVAIVGSALGGLVVRAEPVESVRRPSRRAPAHPRVRLRRAQALLVGTVAGLGTAATELVGRVLGTTNDALSTELARCGPAAVLDALLALVILPLVAGALRSGSLRAPVVTTRPYEARSR